MSRICPAHGEPLDPFCPGCLQDLADACGPLTVIEIVPDFGRQLADVQPKEPS